MIDHDHQLASDTPPAADRRSLRARWVSRPAVRFVLVLAAFMVFLSAWAVASPIGSTPDEDYHLASVWCAQGQRDQACDVSGDPAVHFVPRALVKANCFAFKSELSAACQIDDFVSDGQDMVPTIRGNFGEFAGDYPPLFYSTMSLFVGPDAERSVISMRLFNAALLTTMLAVTYAASSTRGRRALVVTTCVTIIPLGAFIIPSINPSSWAVISGMALFFAISGFLTARTRRQVVTLGTVATLAVVLGAGARADAAMYSVITLGAAVLIWLPIARPTRAILLRLILPVLLAAGAALSFLTAGQAEAAGQSVGRGTMPFIFAFWDIFFYWAGALGYTGLGWLDTPMPSIVWVFGTACFFAVIFVAIGTIGRRRGAVLGLVALSAALVPTYIVATSQDPAGSVQARYIYPLLIVVMAVATLSTEKRPFTLSRVQRWGVVVATSVAGGVAIYTNLRRYVTGLDVGSLPLRPIEWWWTNIPFNPEAICLLGTAGFFVAFSLASRIWVATPAPDEGTVSAGSPARQPS